MLGAGLGATVGKAMAALLRWLGLALAHDWRSWEAATTAFLRLWRRLLRRASPDDTAPWSELPPELLGLVLSRLPSQFDRVRLRAVCRPWRSAPRPHMLPPPFPWIVLRDTFLTLPDGALHPLPRHLCCGEIVARVSTGSTLFFGHLNGRCCLVNPSSGKTTTLKIKLADYSSSMIHKLVLSDHIVAFHTKDKLTIIPRQGAGQMTWAPPGNSNSMLFPHDFDTIADIAVFQRKLYVLTRKYNNPRRQQPELHLLNINDEHNCVRSVQCISATPINDVSPCLSATGTRRLFFFYLVVSSDQLLMVERQIDMEPPYSTHDNPRPRPRPIRTTFEVSEAVDLIGGQGCWSKVDTLMGRALFVSQECSESLPAHCGAREDCIYFMTERNNYLPTWERKPEDDLLDCVVYNVRDRTMEPLAWEAEPARGPWRPTWLFPADV